jgi:ABC-type transport system substrate-binding protein
MVPADLYKQINVVNQGIGTGPYKLVSYTPNQSVEYARWGSFWKKGLPYADALSLKIITDEQARIAALHAGAIHGATIVSGDNARALASDKNLTVLRGLTAAFRELQFTIKAGENKPWADRRVRQAINMAINRADIIAKVYAGAAVDTGHIPPNYGDWPLSQQELQTKWEKFDLPGAQKLMKDAGQDKGFSVNLHVVSASEYPTLAALLKSHLSKINIDVNIQLQDLASFAGDYGKGNFDWLLNGRGMRGDPHGFVGEFNPGASPTYNLWFSGYKNIPMWRLVGNGQITLDPAKRQKMYTQLQRILLTELLEIPLVVPYKFQVVNKKLHEMYVSFTDFNPGLRTVWLSK